MALENDSPPPRPFSLLSLPEAWGGQAVSWRHYVPLAGIFLLLIFGNQVWAQALFVLCIGVTLWLKPPRKALSNATDFFSLCATAVLLLSFLPYFLYRVIPLKWFNQGSWRGQADQLGINISFLYTPQPLLTLEALVLLLAALATVALLVHAPLYPAQRWRYALFSAPVLAVLGILGTLGAPLPGSESALMPALSWAHFPNFGTAMAVGSLLSFALFVSALANRWLAGIALTGFCLLACFIALLYSGNGLWSWTVLAAGLWLVLLMLRTRRTSGLRRAGAILVLLIGFVLVLAGHYEGSSWILNRDRMAERTVRYYDAATVVMQQSAMGIGAGNFQYIFPHYQKRSLDAGIMESPGNDWVWLASENGLIGVAVAALLVFALARTAIGKSGRRSKAIRQAALCALLLFVFGTINETPGHYIGTVALAILCLQIARVRNDERRSSLYPRWLWKLQAAVLVIAAGVWLVSLALHQPWQSGVASEIAMQNLKQAAEAPDPQLLDNAAEAALRFTPLDWKLYQERGIARITLNHEPALAKRDFDRALGLLPRRAEIPYAQGVAWLPLSKQEAERSFRAALERHSANPAQLYADIVATSATDRYFQGALGRLSQTNAGMRFAYLLGSTQPAFISALTADLRDDASLGRFTESERHQIIERWVLQGNAPAAVRYLEDHPEAIDAPWYLRALALARLGSHKDACELLQASIPMAQIPALLQPAAHKLPSPVAGLELAPPGGSSQQMPTEQIIEADGNISYLSAPNLLRQQLDNQQWDAAQQTATLLLAEPVVPPYALYWSAWLHQRAGQFEKAWPLWKAYSVYYLERHSSTLAAQRLKDPESSIASAQAIENWGLIPAEVHIPK